MATSEITVGGEYWDAQLQTFDALDSGDYDLVVFRVGYAGGKTLTGSDWIHQTSVAVAGSDNLVMAPDYAKGGPSTYKTFLERLPGEETIPDKGGDPELADRRGVQPKRQAADVRERERRPPRERGQVEPLRGVGV